MKIEEMKSEMSLFVTYNQIAVFQSDLDDPFNDWTDEHVQQGFSWREGSVSFKTLDDSVDMYIHLRRSNNLEVYDEATRAIAVPFIVSTTGIIEISAIGDSHNIKIPKGSYLLLFQTGKINFEKSNWCEFCFIETDELKPRIIKADSEINRTEKYKMDATSA